MNESTPRPAWIELDLARWRRNYRLILQALPPGVGLLAVVKDEAYGHGLLTGAELALDAGARGLAVSTVEEGVRLRESGITAPVLLLGERDPAELPWCVDHHLTCCLGEAALVAPLADLARHRQRRVPVHLKVNTGMNRYGVPWSRAADLAARIAATPSLQLEGVFSHFAQSDEQLKTFALLQLARFNEALETLRARGLVPGLRHLCNTGGFLDLPAAHYDLVRLGLLPLGVFPSEACRRLPGIEPVLSVKARLTAIQHLATGDHVGYGMRYTAPSPRRIGVLPLGYGDGFPRVRNLGSVLFGGRHAPIVGGVSMDALTVDLTDLPAVQLGDTAVVLGRDGPEEITVHELARLKNSASYDVLCSWRSRLPRLRLTPRQTAFP